MKSKTTMQVLDEIAREQIRKDINLSSIILTKVRKEQRKSMKQKYVLTGMIAVALAAVIMISIPGVASAMKQLIGYVPGIGLVDNSSQLRALKNPITITQFDTAITIEQGVIDSQHTTLVYRIDNIPTSNAVTPDQWQQLCHQLPELRLNKGKTLKAEMISGDNFVNGYNRRVDFPVIPTGTNTIEIVFPCVENTPQEFNSKILHGEIAFIDAPKDFALSPLVDISSPTPMPQQDNSANSVSMQSKDPLLENIKLLVNQYTQVDGTLILFGAVETLDTNIQLVGIDADDIHLVDAGGIEIPIEADPLLINPLAEEANAQALQWAYRLMEPYVPGKATLTADSIWIGVSGDTSFSLDVGANPQPDQQWIVNQELVVSGRTIKIVSAQMNVKGDGLTFVISVPEDVSGVTLTDPKHSILMGAGGPGTYSFIYQGDFPTGIIEIAVSSVSVNIPGHWQVNVDLPTIQAGAGN